MLEIKFCDATKAFFCFYTFHKSNSTLLCRHYSRTSEKIKPIKVAYASYEMTDKFQLDNKIRHPIVIMHGLLGSKNNWNNLSKAMHNRTKHKIIAIDARNHGDSPHTPEFSYPCLTEDIHCLINDLKISKANAIGHSLGGRTMMYLALKYPQLINSLIVVDISPVRTSSAIFEMTQLLNAMISVKLENNLTLSKARKIADAQLAEIISDMYLRQFLLTNLVEVEGGQYKWRINLEAILNNFSNIVNFKLPTNKFKGPVLFIGGSKSTFLKEEDHKDILKLFPKAEFKYVEGAGHWVHSEKPNEFLNLVCDFIDKNG